jgi:hypothetical protein
VRYVGECGDHPQSRRVAEDVMEDRHVREAMAALILALHDRDLYTRGSEELYGEDARWDLVQKALECLRSS